MLEQFPGWMILIIVILAQALILKIALWLITKDCATDEERAKKTEEFLTNMLWPRGW